MFDSLGWQIIFGILYTFAAIAVIGLALVGVYSLVYGLRHRPKGRGYPPLRGPRPLPYSFSEVVRRTRLVIEQYWVDRSQVDPEVIPDSGISIFCGVQGAGKTYSAVRYISRLVKKYPKTELLSNIELSIPLMNGFAQHKLISNWYEIGEGHRDRSTVVLLDEIQTWGSSLQSKQAPPELLALAAQQRKRKMLLIGTVQVPGRLIKPIREQVKFWYVAQTFFGVLTVVRKYKGEQWSEERQEFTGSPVGVSWDIQNMGARLAYDTLKIVEGADLSGIESWRSGGTQQVASAEASKGKGKVK